MPSTCCSRASASLTSARLSTLPRPPERSIGCIPTARRNQATTWATGPLPAGSNISLFAGKVIWRGSIAGVNSVSPQETWLLTRITGPEAGTFSAPSIQGRHSSRITGRNSSPLKIE